MQGVLNYQITVRPQVLFNFDSYDYRAICLFFACLIYGVFGSPTPDHLGIAELCVGVLLALSVGIGRARDVVFALIMVGLIFSMRSILMREMIGCDIWCTDEQLYLENMPSVLFACLILIGASISIVARGLTLKNITLFFILLMISALPLAAMIATSQRASVGAVALYVLLILAYFIYKTPVRGANALIMLLIVGGIVNFSLFSIFSSLWEKTQNVGLNMRPQEFEAVWDVVTRDPVTFLFGLGWGGQFESPAVGGLRVNFTHNFFSSMLLKAGCVGVMLCMLYIAGLLERLARVVIRNPVIGLALAAPILIDLTLYASFKSLDFGLVLLMISGSLVYFR